MALLSFNKKRSFIVLAITTLFTGTALNAATLDDSKIERIQRDMKIMNNILKTSLNEQKNARTSIDNVYLAGQGMLFTIGQKNGFQFDFRNFAMPDMPVRPPKPPKATAPVVSSDPGLDMVFTESQIAEIERYAESAMEIAEISLDYMSDIDWSSFTNAERSEQKALQASLRAEQRKLEHDARKLEREVRSVERKLRDSEFEQELENAKKDPKLTESLKKEMDKLTASLSGIADKMKNNAAKLKAKAEEMKAEQQQKMKVRLAETETVISEIVCDFGSGLRSLPDGQHISFRIDGHSSRMYVFNKKDIMKCGDGKTNAKTLLEQATKYAM